MGLRTGSSTAERGAWPRSLRGTIVAGPTPSRAHDNDCLCLPAASTSHQSEAGKKESPDHHLNPACQPCAEPSSISSFDCRLINARTADNGSAQNGSTNKSAKVVLGSRLINRKLLIRFVLFASFPKARERGNDSASTTSVIYEF